MVGNLLGLSLDNDPADQLNEGFIGRYLSGDLMCGFLLGKNMDASLDNTGIWGNQGRIKNVSKGRSRKLIWNWVKVSSRTRLWQCRTRPWLDDLPAKG
jgi:hypothetical protein